MLCMLKIRLQRTGRKRESTFRIVLTDSKNGPQSGRFKEILGSYNPGTNEKLVKADRITYWIGHGAKTSGTVHNILVGEGVIKGKKINVLPKKSPVVDEEAIKAEAEAKEKAAEEAKAKAEADAAPVEEVPAEEASTEEKKEETPVEEVVEEKTDAPKEETPAPEATEEKTDTPAEETPEK
jgi:small subunit ribosomal protein S16